MRSALYIFINALLHFTHLAIITASLLLWILPHYQKAHLFLQLIILLSWLGIGTLKKDLGYCLATDLQRRWKLAHGYNFPTSYMVYLWHMFGFKNMSEKKINKITFSVFGLTCLASLIVLMLTAV